MLRYPLNYDVDFPGQLKAAYGSGFRENSRPVIADAAPDPVAALIRSRDWTGELGQLGRAVIEVQLATHAQSKDDARLRSVKTGALADQAALKVIESFDGDEANAIETIKSLQSIPRSLTSRTIWDPSRLTYPGFISVRRALRLLPSTSELLDDVSMELLNADVDEWIIRHERGMRDAQGADWGRNLVAFSKHAETVFPDAMINTDSSQSLHRASMSGFTFLDDSRPVELKIQLSLQAFRAMFDLVTGGLLNGLDWSNVFVAGGIVLSSLSCTTPQDLEKYKTSDIDIYIYGLDPVAANRKIEEIFDVWKANLPDDAKSDILVVRNSRTFTFFSKYPIKRVQIVLKLVGSPKEVLLNFDLDQCAMGWDGEEVWMLPRAVRALETGYTVFTMNMIEGHYLGERRATQEQRVFKYADKGYGIRILPSYLESLEEIFPSYEQRARGQDDRYEDWERPLFYHAAHFELIFEQGTLWTIKALKAHFGSEWANDKPNASHLMLEERSRQSSEPADRSCLSGLQVFARHVALWREKAKGNLTIDDTDWATTEYNVPPNVPLGYEDMPTYRWNQDFTITGLQQELERFNQVNDECFTWNTEWRDLTLDDFLGPNDEKCTRRVCCGPTAVSTLATPSIIPMFVPPEFLTYANNLVREALIAHGFEAVTLLEDMLTPGSAKYTTFLEQTNVIPVKWKIGATVTWQLIDRRIDEVFEVLWSFYRSHDKLDAEEQLNLRRLFTELSRRSIRTAPYDEFVSFAKWVMRKPQSFAGSYGNGQCFWDEVERPDEDEDQDNDIHEED